MRCEECGFVYEELAQERIAGAMLSFGPRYRAALAGRSRPELTRRPEPGTWSALEYACHARDVFLVQRDRALLALVEDRPRFAPMYREERVELAGYASEDPHDVAGEIEVAAGLLARLLARLTPAQLARPCVYNFPAPAEVDLAWVGRHSVHEGEHHLCDIDRVLAAVTGAG